jgi:hypothetical protein
MTDDPIPLTRSSDGEDSGALGVEKGAQIYHVRGITVF